MTFVVMMSPHFFPSPSVKTWSILLTVDSRGSTFSLSIFAMWACETPTNLANCLWVNPASALNFFSVVPVMTILITSGYFLYRSKYRKIYI